MVNLSLNIKVVVNHDGTKITDSCLILTGIQGDLSAQVRAVNDSTMILGTAHITRVLKGDPWVSCFKKHLQHALPQFNCGH